MKAIAYVHGPKRVHVLGHAFYEGCKRRGIQCEVRPVGGSYPDADLVWLYGLGPARPVFDAYEGRAVRLVGDKGYFAEYETTKYFRVSVDAQQPDKHLLLRPHPPDRFKALNLPDLRTKTRGDYVLLCGIGPKQAERQGVAYGQWERETYKILYELTDRPILVREKPKNPLIAGLPRSTHKTTAEAIRGAWAVVCMTGNIGVDAILEGVPVIAKAGPGAVYYRAGLHSVNDIQPLDEESRLSALSDVAYWQWTQDEIKSGLFLDNLKLEGII